MPATAWTEARPGGPVKSASKRLPQWVVWIIVLVLIIVQVVTLRLWGGLGSAAASVTPASAVLKPAGITLIGGCAGVGRSFDKNGKLLGTVRIPGSPPASKDRPLLVDPKGTVTYSGSSMGPITNHNWSVALFGITVKSGGSANNGKKTTTSGTQKMSSYIPFKFTGLYYLHGAIAGTGGACSGSMWIKALGSPTGTVFWYIALGLVVIAVLLLVTAFPRVRRHRK